jgi:uncharacterized membrane protein (DUF4010 family)
LLLRFTVLFAAILLAAKLFGNKPSDFFLLASVSGLLDVDPITLSMAKLSGSGVAQSVVVLTILIAAAANALAKSVLATAFGGARLGLGLGACGLLACGAGGLVYLSAA